MREIKGLKFVLTCEECLEQYDVFWDDRCVGCVRLRHGYLLCKYPDAGGEILYSKVFVNGDMGNLLRVLQWLMEVVDKFSKLMRSA